MTIIDLAIIAYFIIGLAFAYRMAINPISIIVLVLAWPLVAILFLLAYPINDYAKRKIRGK